MRTHSCSSANESCQPPWDEDELFAPFSGPARAENQTWNGEYGAARHAVEFAEELRAKMKPPARAPVEMTRIDFAGAIEAKIDQLKRSTDPIARADAKYLALWKRAELLYDDGELAGVMRALARHAPTGASEELVLSTCGIFGHPDLVRELWRQARASAEAEPEVASDVGVEPDIAEMNSRYRVDRRSSVPLR